MLVPFKKQLGMGCLWTIGFNLMFALALWGFAEWFGDDSAKPEEKVETPAKTVPAPATPEEREAALKAAYAELDSLVGLAGVKAEVRKLANFARIAEERRKKGLKTASLNCHMVFTGNPGTGKTTVARIVAKILHALGVVSKGQLVEVDRAAFVGQYKGETEKNAERIIKSAIGGVLFIDEAYALAPKKGQADSDSATVIAQVLKAMEDHRDDLVVAVAGYAEEMRHFLDANPGMKSRFNRYIDFPDYSAAELAAIFRSMAKKNEYSIAPDADAGLERAMAEFTRHRDRQFGNARFVRNLFEKSLERQATRLASVKNLDDHALTTLTKADIDLKPPEEADCPKFEDVMRELDSLTGMAQVKAEVKKLANWVKVAKEREAQGLDTAKMSYHMVFTGNPGTGKTTVARIVAKVFRSLGILRKGQLVETDRSGLVAEYVGQTAVKTNKKVDEALDGVLFIDEAYALAGEGKDYGAEAVATLLKRMEDERDRLVVIIAGYTDEMDKFMNLNSGLKSRFNRYIDFPDFTSKELAAMFRQNASKNKYVLSADVERWLDGAIGLWTRKRDRRFGNGRYIRNLFEKTLERQASRVAAIEHPTKEQLVTITLHDVGIRLKDPNASQED